ncbi:geranylgeranyl reductase family protein [Nitriliruptor alkaliphilus]|uniref:geranylgeranyl reductase family protein n=1 Tax=Nitriliruptor alkaliphilus TaxID=427918 RepID=UPI000696E269|nr:geranylgeranyl reductase family protein [Nitriliruptor alkaliphilus]
MAATLGAVTDADVVVAGAGPGGAAAAAHLAARGHDVVLLEKDRFPRDKVCGDGLTPRVVGELLELGMVDEAHGRVDGWATQKGLRIHGGSTAMELPWPQLDDWPSWGATATRKVFDEAVARRAQSFGAVLHEGVAVTGPRWRDGSESRVAGVTWRDEDGREGEVRAPVVIAADGASGGLSKRLGVTRRTDRPMAVAARTYYRSPRADDEWISSFLDLTDADGDLLSGYGWVFPLDDGTINVGLGLLSTSKDFRAVSYRRLLQSWAGGMADEWHTTEDNRTDAIRSGPIPMGFNRTPLHQRGVLLVGDSGGMVNPFNGEGISYAMEAARLAAEVVDGAFTSKRTADLDAYDRELRQRWGGYYTLGKVFAELVGHPAVMHVCTTYGMPVRPLMELVFKLMAHLTDRHPSDTKDVVINTLSRLAPAA